ncbi:MULTISPECIES: DinB family protein [unclassified Arthrobacter]|uniref:mycothiol transferase n=1 Tax=unclassified Arthrobacter TaxID=235627 RepID=UPI00159E4020|nr:MULTISPECIES: DinB family protein [unclassified Arthrobacter]MCQ9162487.1 DinB family protein [Arthrobacter sp. STN4]NVM98313.1 DinB family protein [Arthrobacter sp. SDTb3-6]
MKTTDLLVDAFGRIGDIVGGVLDGMDLARINWRPGGAGNSVAWLVWHLSRGQDEQIADVAGIASVWQSGGYAARFGFALDPKDTGYGHSAAQVDKVRVESTDLLREYHQAVLAQSLDYVRGLSDADLDRVVDKRWNPAVTLGVRLISIVDDCVQHGGQAAYVKGLPPVL